MPPSALIFLSNLISLVFLFGCWILCYLLIGWLVEKMFCFLYVFFFIQHHHCNPLVCSKDYSAVIFLQFFDGLEFFFGYV